MGEKTPTTLGRYELLALLATGGMAEIHLAKQSGIAGFERLVVVKKILTHLARDKNFLQMFFDEARIAAQLNHPNIVQIYDLGQEDEETYFIAMEYLEGESLAYLVSEARRNQTVLPTPLAAGILAQVCDGLEYAHSFHDNEGNPLHLVHRDVSPQNIIVLFSGGVKLVDFGVAKAATQLHETRVGTMKGKVSYMAPEQCKGQPVDARTDVFSLGVVLWELLTRRRLFKRDSEAATLHAVVSGEIPRVREIRPQVSGELEEITLRALQADPANRFASAGEMGAALREVLRTTGAAAGVREIAAFVNEVFAERARTKRKLLEEIRATGGTRIDLAVLKPETQESLPSKSRVEDDIPIVTGTMVDRPDISHEPTFIKPTDGERAAPPPLPPSGSPRAAARPPDAAPGPATAPPHPARSRNLLIWIVLPVVCFAGGFTGWWLMSKATSGTGPDPQPEGPRVVSPPDRPDPVDAGSRTAEPRPSDPGPREPDAAPGGADRAAATPADPGRDEGPSPEAARPVELSVQTTPAGCKARLDGSELPGVTPMEPLFVEPGREHRVDVLCPRHQEETKRFQGTAGEKVRLVFKPPALATETVKPGYLRLDTEPWSEVYLGNRKLGITPLLKVRLGPGKYTLTAINEKKGLKQTFQVIIRSGKTTTVYKKLSE